MAQRQSPQRQRLTLAASNIAPTGVSEIMAARDLVGLDMARIPQELAAFVPDPATRWRRGTCSPAVATPDGRQAICFGTLDDIRAAYDQCGEGIPVNGPHTLWVVNCEDG
jgi:hypothetical protein